VRGEAGGRKKKVTAEIAEEAQRTQRKKGVRREA
jgi:hypothetical protein